MAVFCGLALISCFQERQPGNPIIIGGTITVPFELRRLT